MNAEILSPEAKSFLVARETSPNYPIPKRSEVSPFFLERAETIEGISSTWNPVKVYTASSESIDRERAILFEHFKEGRRYNPQLEYPAAEKPNIVASRPTLLGELRLTRSYVPKDPVDAVAKDVTIAKLRDDLAMCDLVEGMMTKNERQIARAMRRTYPGSDPVFMAYAQKLYEQKTREGEPKPVTGRGLIPPSEHELLKKLPVTAEQQKEGFEWFFQKGGILRKQGEKKAGFFALVEPETQDIDVRDKSEFGPYITIAPDKNRANPMMGDHFLGILAHEGGHAIQSTNGYKLFLVGGGPLKLNNEQLYEGHGLNEETNTKQQLFGIEEAAPRSYYPFGVYMAEQGHDFYSIFSNQVERHLRIEKQIAHDKDFPSMGEFDDKDVLTAMRNAWRVTYRVMRGHIDMSNKSKYAMPKDLGYLRGWMTNRDLVQSGYGYVNASAVIGQGGLEKIALFKFDESMLPHRTENLPYQFYQEVLKPRLKTA